MRAREPRPVSGSARPPPGHAALEWSLCALASVAVAAGVWGALSALPELGRLLIDRSEDLVDLLVPRGASR